MANVDGKRKRGPTLDEVARMVLQRRAPALTEAEQNAENVRLYPKVTLPRVRFLEAPLPAWWNEDFERRPVMNDPKWQPPL